MIIKTIDEYRVQRWDGKCWRQGAAMTTSEAAANMLRLRHERFPDRTFRIIRITTTIEAGPSVGPLRVGKPPLPIF